MDYKEQADLLIDALPDFAKSYFKELRARRMSERTLIQYAYDIKGFLNWIQDQAGYKNIDIMNSSAKDILDKLTIDDIHEYSESIQDYKDINGKRNDTSDSYLARKMSSLRSFFKYYNQVGLSNSSLYALIRIPKVSAKEIAVLEYSEVDRLLEAVDDTSNMSDEEKLRYEKHLLRDKAIVTLLFGTGIRVSELVNIDIDDIDLFNASIVITRKGGDEDIVYFPTAVEATLVDYFENGRPRLAADTKEKAFFLSNRGTRLSVRAVELLMKDLKSKTGIAKKVTPHSARRVYGTHVYTNTGDIYLAASALNHKSVETTKKHYAKQDEEYKRKAAKVASTIFNEEK